MLKERSLEEIMGILQTFPEVFKDRFGRKITKQELIKHLNDRLHSQELQQFKTQFDNFTPQALKAAISTIENGSFENIEDDSSNGSHLVAQDLSPAQFTEDVKHNKKNKKQWKDIF